MSEIERRAVAEPKADRVTCLRGRGATQLRWCHAIGLSDRVIEAAKASIAGREGDFGQGQGRIADELLCGEKPPVRGNGLRPGTEMQKKETPQLPLANAEPRCKPLHRFLIKR